MNVCIVKLLIDFCFYSSTVRMMEEVASMKKGCCVAVVIMLMMTMMTGCSSMGKAGGITITAQNTPEGYILTSMVRDLLEQAGYRVNELPGMTGAAARKALLDGTIDACIDYTGKAWTRYLQGKQHVQDPQKMLAMVQQADRMHGIVWIDGMLQVNAMPAVVIPEKCIHTLGKRISDLINYQIKTHEGALNFDIPADEYSENVPGGFRQMMKWYIMTTTISVFAHPCDSTKEIARDLAWDDTLAANERDIWPIAGILPRTEPGIQKYGLAALQDDKKFYCVYTPALCIRQGFLQQHPEIARVLQPLAQTLTQQDMIQLNARVEIDGLAPRDAAMRYLKAKKLLL